MAFLAEVGREFGVRKQVPTELVSIGAEADRQVGSNETLCW